MSRNAQEWSEIRRAAISFANARIESNEPNAFDRREKVITWCLRRERKAGYRESEAFWGQHRRGRYIKLSLAIDIIKDAVELWRTGQTGGKLVENVIIDELNATFNQMFGGDT